MTYYIINERDMTIRIQVKYVVWNNITYCHFLKSLYKLYADYYPASKGFFNVSKITKEHSSSRLCSNVIFLNLSRFLRAGYKQKFCWIIERFFFSRFLLKIKCLWKEKCCVLYCKIQLYFTKNTWICSTFQNFYLTKFLQ